MMRFFCPIRYVFSDTIKFKTYTNLTLLGIYDPLADIVIFLTYLSSVQ